MTYAVEARDLKKAYEVKLGQEGFRGKVRALFKPEIKTIHAVSGIDLTISQGEILGYIGPNGAGKSTTIKMLSGILQPTSGQVSVCGLDPFEDRIQNALNIGAVFGQRTQLWWDLPVRDTFALLKRMYSVPDEVYEANLQLFDQYLDLRAIESQPVRQLSLGQRMRAEIASALLHNPKVLFLDEPTIGLDIDVKMRIRDFILKINRERGVTILLTTHDLQDIEALADRVVVINHGQLCFDGSLDDLRASYSSTRTLSCLLETSDTVQLSPGLAELCDLRQEGSRIEIAYPPEVSSKEVLSDLMSRYDLSEIEFKDAQIEDIVMEIYRS